MTRTISSRINTQGLGVVHLNGYKLTEVIAELIDNTIDSYTKNSMTGTLIVDIVFKNEEIVYRDNAYGFDTNSFENAFQTHIRNTEDVTYGTYGVGMKHAFLWLGKNTIIESISQIDQRGYRTIYPNIIDDQIQDHLILEENLDLDMNHFNTRFTIREPRYYHYNAANLLDLTSSLEEIYKYHAEYLQLNINGKLLNFATKFEIANTRYVGDYKTSNDGICLDKSDSEIVSWKYELPSPLTSRTGQKEYSLTGFIGLQMGTSLPESGLRIYRNKRCVLGFSANDRFRPFGSSNSHASKGIVGEFHINGFEKVTIGQGLPEIGMLKELLTHLQARMKQGDYNDPIADRMFVQAGAYRWNTHPSAPLCSTIAPQPSSGRPTAKGSGSRGGTNGGAHGTLPSTSKAYRIQIADQMYQIKTQMASGPALFETSTSQTGEIEINLKMDVSLNEITVKLFAEIYDVHLKFKQISGLNPNDEIRELLTRLGS